MTKGSSNPFPSLLLVEQGSTPASPAGGDQRLFIRTSDHALCYVNSSGTVTLVATGAVLAKARAHTTAGQSIPDNTSTIVNFGTVDWDTAGAITTGASWHFTVPTTGKYMVNVAVIFSSANTYSDIAVHVNGTLVAYLDRKDAIAAQFNFTKGTTTLSVTAGDTIDFRTSQTSGGALTLLALAAMNYCDIVQVG